MKSEKNKKKSSDNPQTQNGGESPTDPIINKMTDIISDKLKEKKDEIGDMYELLEASLNTIKSRRPGVLPEPLNIKSQRTVVVLDKINKKWKDNEIDENTMKFLKKAWERNS